MKQEKKIITRTKMSPIITDILIPLSQRQGTDTILRSNISDSVK